MHTITLSTHSLEKYFIQGNNRVYVLKNVSVIFEHGASYAIKGISGSGKSTLLHILAGLEKPTGGTVMFNAQDISLFKSSEQSRFLHSTIGLIFQMPHLINELSVIENVFLKGLIAGIHYDECRIKAYQLLDQVGLTAKADAKPSTLSGGQQQRIAILRALFNKPSFLLADEPTSNLDEKTGKDVIDFLLDCYAQWRMGIIVSSHDVHVINRMETIFSLGDGRLVHDQSLSCKNFQQEAVSSLT